MTMYSNQLAVAIKAAGQVLREQKDQVFLPFGTEYSIYVKNLNTVRALVRIELDGESVTGTDDLVVHPNDSIDLERFMKSGNKTSGNRFKFIERNAKVEAGRGGIQVEDGLLRVEFQFEKVTPAPVYVPTIPYNPYHWKPHPWKYNDYWDGYYDGKRGGAYQPEVFYNALIGSPLCGGVASGGSSGTLGVGDISSNSFTMNTLNDGHSVTCNLSSPIGGAVANSFTLTSSNVSQNCGAKEDSSILRSLKSTKMLKSAELYSAEVEKKNDAGITVPGSISNQKFTVVSSFPVEDMKHVIILKLLGETGSGKVISRAVTVKQKQTCSTCKTRNRGQNKFCRECGTSLELV